MVESTTTRPRRGDVGVADAVTAAATLGLLPGADLETLAELLGLRGPAQGEPTRPQIRGAVALTVEKAAGGRP